MVRKIVKPVATLTTKKQKGKISKQNYNADDDNDKNNKVKVGKKG